MKYDFLFLSRLVLVITQPPSTGHAAEGQGARDVQGEAHTPTVTCDCDMTTTLQPETVTAVAVTEFRLYLFRKCFCVLLHIVMMFGSQMAIYSNEFCSFYF